MLNRDLMVGILFWVAIVIIMLSCALLVLGFGHDL